MSCCVAFSRWSVTSGHETWGQTHTALPWFDCYTLYTKARASENPPTKTAAASNCFSRPCWECLCSPHLRQYENPDKNSKIHCRLNWRAPHVSTLFRHSHVVLFNLVMCWWTSNLVKTRIWSLCANPSYLVSKKRIVSCTGYKHGKRSRPRPIGLIGSRTLPVEMQLTLQAPEYEQMNHLSPSWSLISLYHASLPAWNFPWNFSAFIPKSTAIDFKLLLQLDQQYCIAQYEELGFS